MIRLRSDVERKRIAGLASSAASGSGIEEGLYSQEMSHRTYAYLGKLAENLLAAGWPVIVDAAFLARWQRNLMRETALRQQAIFRILDIEVEHAVLRERIAQRIEQWQDASEADLRVLQRQIDTAEPLSADERNELIKPDKTE